MAPDVPPDCGLAATEQAVWQQVAREASRVVPATAIAIVPAPVAVIPVVLRAATITIPVVIAVVVSRVVPDFGNGRAIGCRISRGRDRQRGQWNCDKRAGDGHSGQPPAGSGRLCCRRHHGSFLSCGEPRVHHPSGRGCTFPTLPQFGRKAMGLTPLRRMFILWYEATPSPLVSRVRVHSGTAFRTRM